MGATPLKPLRAAIPWLCAAASGILTALAYPPFNQEWLAWTGLIPLLAALWFFPARARINFLRGGLMGLSFFAVNLHWITTVTGLGYAVFILYLALFPAGWAVFAGSLAPSEQSAFTRTAHNLGLAALTACGWVAQEWLRSTLFSGFCWNTLGVALHRNLPLIQISAITGVLGLSFVVAFGNVILLTSLRRLSLELGRLARLSLRPHYDFNLSLLLLIAVFGYGVHRIGEKREEISVRIAVIQPNIPQEEKWNPAHELAIHETLRTLTAVAAATKPQLIVWPEASTPQALFASEQTLNFVTSTAQAAEVPLLIGSLDFDAKGDYNAAFLIPPQPGQIQTYRKIHLVPFGEFIPFRNSFPLFAWIVGDLVPGDFLAGTKPELLHLDTPPIALAPLICFEDTLGPLVRQFAGAGAQLLVNLTNDGWFLRSPESEQHLANAKFRTVETGLPMVRAANTGVSVVISSTGRVQKELRDPDGSTFLSGTFADHVNVPKFPKATLYVRYGDWLAWACLVITTATVVVRFRKQAQ